MYFQKIIGNNIMMKERFEKLKGENFPKTEENFGKENYVYKASKNAAVQNTDEKQENKNSNFPVILIDEEETIFIEVGRIQLT